MSPIQMSSMVLWTRPASLVTALDSLFIPSTNYSSRFSCSPCWLLPPRGWGSTFAVSSLGQNFVPERRHRTSGSLRARLRGLALETRFASAPSRRQNSLK